MSDEPTPGTARRGFLGSVAAAAVGLGAASLMPESAHASAFAPGAVDPKLEAWFGKLTGKHKTIFDAPEPNGGMPAIWPRVYLNTTDATYPGEHAVAMVILRHAGLAMGLTDAIWAKYSIGETFKVMNGNAPATANPWGTITNLPLPGLGIAELLKGGVLIGACDVALTIYSAGAAAKMKMDPAAVKKEWIAGLFPGIMVVPSGVFAAARAQEFGANYIFAG
ncbi:MAG: twin-arginine translocation signal domain-containing protein [Gemmatimonadales bacterium]